LGQDQSQELEKILLCVQRGVSETAEQHTEVVKQRELALTQYRAEEIVYEIRCSTQRQSTV
jgi:hypothetical protein